MSSTPLPRSLDPLPEESLPGYLLRLAHRLDISPLQVALHTGLSTNRGQNSVAASVTVAMNPAMTADFARATRLHPDEVTGLTLVSLADRYPFLRPGFIRSRGAHRRAAAVSLRESWVFTHFTRYCPDCLSGDGSPIQQRHGGGWNKLWRLPVVFACPTHRRFLELTCPACGIAALHRRAGLARPVPMAGQPVTHPAACRNPAPHQPSLPCGHRVDQSIHGTRTPIDERLLDLQRDLLALLRDSDPPHRHSLGQPTSPASYLTDLRILAALARASWPAAQNLLDGGHAEHLPAVCPLEHSEASHATMPQLDTPPPDSAACGNLLACADQLLTGDPARVERLVAETVDAVPSSSEWIKTFLRGEGYCSTAMQHLAGARTRAAHVMSSLGIPPRPIQPAPQPVGFGPEHVPQYLPADWYQSLFADIGVDTVWVRRAVPILLVRLCAGGSLRRAGPRIGLARNAGRHALDVVTSHLDDSTADQRRWNSAMRALTGKLGDDSRTDYGKRRTALATWSLPETDWRSMISDLVGRPVNGKTPPHVDWSDQKRLLASVWIWTRITSGEHHYAPILFPSAPGRRPGGPLSEFVHRRWPDLANAHAHYGQLRPRLDAYAKSLAVAIDNAPPKAPKADPLLER
jgi:hypothetical protein